MAMSRAGRTAGWAGLAAAVVAGAAAAQEPTPPVTLEVAVRAALVNHPALEAARARLDAAEAGVGEARSGWLPTVGTQAHATRYQEPMVVAPLHGFDPMDPPGFERTLVQGHAVAEWLAFDGGARSARVESARSAAEGAEAGLVAAGEAVIAEAVSSYVSAGTAAALQAAHEEALGALETERSRASLLLEQGKTPRVALLRSEAALSRARAELAAATEAHRLALRRLARTTGLAPERLEAGLDPVRIAGTALGDAGTTLVHTVARHGYRFDAEVVDPDVLPAHAPMAAASPAASGSAGPGRGTGSAAPGKARLPPRGGRPASPSSRPRHDRKQ